MTISSNRHKTDLYSLKSGLRGAQPASTSILHGLQRPRGRPEAQATSPPSSARRREFATSSAQMQFHRQKSNIYNKRPRRPHRPPERPQRAQGQPGPVVLPPFAFAGKTQSINSNRLRPGPHERPRCPQRPPQPRERPPRPLNNAANSGGDVFRNMQGYSTRPSLVTKHRAATTAT